MTSRVQLVALIAALSFSLGAWPALAEEIAATSKIDAVTVYPAGARVTRLAKVKIAKGAHVIKFSDLAAQAMPNSIRVEGSATGGLDIGSVDSRRLNVASNDAAVLASERKRIEDEIEALRDKRREIDARIRAASTQIKLLTNMAQLPLHISGGPGGQAAPAAATDWGQIYTMIGERMAAAEAEVNKARIEQRDLDRQIKDLEGKLNAVAPTQKIRTEVKVNVNAAADLEANLIIHYQVRRASWTPLYDARLSTGAKAVAPKLALQRRASISQRSGEAWTNVKLSLSTSQPAAGSTAPQLMPTTVDFLQPRRPPPRPVPMASGRARSMAPQAEALQDQSRPYGGAANARKKMAMVRRARPVSATVKVAPFQAVFEVPGRQSIAETGEVKRVTIDSTSLEPVLVVHTVPKRLAKAFLYAKIKLPKGTPYLPGSVQLFRDGTFVGTGRLPLLRPGQSHELGFGQDDSVLVKYAILREKRGETGIISSTKTDSRNYKITVKNLHERAIDLVVIDQIPVSKNQDIRVEFTGDTPPTTKNFKDRRGVYAWETKMRSDQELVINFGYRVSWPAAKNIRYGR